MRCLLYVSSATRSLISGDGLAGLLATCQRNNRALGVTGLLVFSGGNFLQVLEGEEGTLKVLFARIARDGRHRGVTRLLGADLDRRRFPAWAMELRDLDDLPPEQQASCRRLMRSGVAGEERPTAEVATLLAAFASVAR